MPSPHRPLVALLAAAALGLAAAGCKARKSGAEVASVGTDDGKPAPPTGGGSILDAAGWQSANVNTDQPVVLPADFYTLLGKWQGDKIQQQFLATMFGLTAKDFGPLGLIMVVETSFGPAAVANVPVDAVKKQTIWRFAAGKSGDTKWTGEEQAALDQLTQQVLGQLVANVFALLRPSAAPLNLFPAIPLEKIEDFHRGIWIQTKSGFDVANTGLYGTFRQNGGSGVNALAYEPVEVSDPDRDPALKDPKMTDYNLDIKADGCTPPVPSAKTPPVIAAFALDMSGGGSAPVGGDTISSPCFHDNADALAMALNLLANTERRVSVRWATQDNEERPVRITLTFDGLRAAKVNTYADLLHRLAKEGYDIEVVPARTIANFLGFNYVAAGKKYALRFPTWIRMTNLPDQPTFNPMEHGEIELILHKDGKRIAQTKWFFGVPDPGYMPHLGAYWRAAHDRQQPWTAYAYDKALIDRYDDAQRINKDGLQYEHSTPIENWLVSTAYLSRAFRMLDRKFQVPNHLYGLYFCSDSIAMAIAKNNEMTKRFTDERKSQIFPLIGSGRLDLTVPAGDGNPIYIDTFDATYFLGDAVGFEQGDSVNVSSNGHFDNYKSFKSLNERDYDVLKDVPFPDARQPNSTYLWGEFYRAVDKRKKKMKARLEAAYPDAEARFPKASWPDKSTWKNSTAPVWRQSTIQFPLPPEWANRSTATSQ